MLGPKWQPQEWRIDERIRIWRILGKTKETSQVWFTKVTQNDKEKKIPKSSTHLQRKVPLIEKIKFKK